MMNKNSKKKTDMFMKHFVLGSNKSPKMQFEILREKGKVTRSFTLVSSERALFVEYAC